MCVVKVCLINQILSKSQVSQLVKFWVFLLISAALWCKDFAVLEHVIFCKKTTMIWLSLSRFSLSLSSILGLCVLNWCFKVCFGSLLI